METNIGKQLLAEGQEINLSGTDLIVKFDYRALLNIETYFNNLQHFFDELGKIEMKDPEGKVYTTVLNGLVSSARTKEGKFLTPEEMISILPFDEKLINEVILVIWASLAESFPPVAQTIKELEKLATKEAEKSTGRTYTDSVGKSSKKTVGSSPQPKSGKSAKKKTK